MTLKISVLWLPQSQRCIPVEFNKMEFTRNTPKDPTVCIQKNKITTLNLS